MTVLVGGVRQSQGGPLDFGHVALQRLGSEQLGVDVVVEDLSPGVVDMARRLEQLQPETLVLVAAAARGRPPGTVQRRLAKSASAPSGEVRLDADMAQGDAAVDRVLQVASAGDSSPARIVVVEVEPVSAEAAEQLSPPVQEVLEAAVELVRAEIRRAPLLDLAGQLRDVMASDHLEPTPVVEAVEAVLAELAALEREGRWGRAFAERDRLRLRISAGEHAGDAVGGLHWAMWWALIEELDRLQALEATSDLS